MALLIVTWRIYTISVHVFVVPVDWLL